MTLAILSLGRNRRLSAQRNRLADQQDGDVLANRVHELAVFANKPAVAFTGDRLAAAVAQLARLNLGVEPLHQRRIRGGQWLMRLRAAQDFQEFRIDHNLVELKTN